MTEKTIGPNITAIVLYGSYARGDSDSESDIDVCVFTKDGRPTCAHEIEPFLAIPNHARLSLTTYSETDLTAMMEYGSLFLWHLRLEGRIVFGDEYLVPNLAKLRAFDKHREEIAYHQQIFDDLITAANGKNCPNEFDLALLFTIARNCCMVLAHKAEIPAFGRHSCYQAAAQKYRDLPLDQTTYLKLARWKMIYERAIDTDEALPNMTEMERLQTVLRGLLEYATAHTR